jgi:hypothetical protein
LFELVRFEFEFSLVGGLLFELGDLIGELVNWWVNWGIELLGELSW